MGLQLRRGTNAERLQITPLAGELIFTTDTKSVFVGDGTTFGGIPVTAFTAEDAQDAVSTLFDRGTHSGISFVYNDNNNSISAVVDGAFSDSISTLADVALVEPLTTGQVLKYNGTSWINDTDLSNVGLLSVEEDTNPRLGGNLDLSTFNISGFGNIEISGDINSTGNIDVTGDLSSTGNCTLTNTRVYSGVLNPSTGLTVFSITDGTTTYPGWSEIIIGKGNWEETVNPEAGNFLGGYKIATYANGANRPVVLIGAELTATSDIESTIPAADLYIAVGKNGTTCNYVFRSSGVLEAPVVQTGSYTTTERDLLTPQFGMMIYNTTLNKFQGYQNTGGTTPEWVDLS